MITQYNGKIVPEPKVKDEEEANIENACNELLNKCNKLLDSQKINEALNSVFSVIRLANKYIDITEPWKLSKDESKKDKLDTVLYYLSETIRICTTILQAYLVEIPAKIFEKFNVEKNLQTFDSIAKFSLENFGKEVNKGENLFPRLDVAKEIEFLDTANTAEKEEKKENKMEEKEIKETENVDKVNTVSYINYDDFAKVKLITGKVINSEKVENADKLLKNTIEMGNETRTIVSGIAKYYTPEEIIGKTVVVVSNLAPRKLRGIESQGMLLCGVDEEKDIVSLVTVDKPLPSGKEVC